MISPGQDQNFDPAIAAAVDRLYAAVQSISEAQKDHLRPVIKHIHQEFETQSAEATRAYNGAAQPLDVVGWFKKQASSQDGRQRLVEIISANGALKTAQDIHNAIDSQKRNALDATGTFKPKLQNSALEVTLDLPASASRTDPEATGEFVSGSTSRIDLDTDFTVNGQDTRVASETILVPNSPDLSFDLVLNPDFPFRNFQYIAHGGFGVVLKATEVGEFEQPIRQVALKILSQIDLRALKHSEDGKLEHVDLKAKSEIMRSEREYEIAGKRTETSSGVSVNIHSRHKIEILPVTTDSSTTARTSRLVSCTAMELLDGTLDDLVTNFRSSLTGKPATDNLALYQLLSEQMQPAIMAVHDAHINGIVHRDIKPGNIFFIINEIGQTQMKIGDWGLGKPIGDLHLDNPDYIAPDQQSSFETQQGVVMGSPRYMAPEQARAEKVSPQADVYALGATLYEILAGKAPYEDVFKPVEIIQRWMISASPHHSKAEPQHSLVPLAKINPHIEPELIAIVNKAMAVDLSVRYKTAKELHADLALFLGRKAKKPTQCWLSVAEKERIRSVTEEKLSALPEVLKEPLVLVFAESLIFVKQAQSAIRYARSTASAKTATYFGLILLPLTGAAGGSYWYGSLGAIERADAHVKQAKELEQSNNPKALKDAEMFYSDANNQLGPYSLWPGISENINKNNAERAKLQGRTTFYNQILIPAKEIVSTYTFDYGTSHRAKGQDRDLEQMLYKLIPGYDQKGAVENFKMALDLEPLTQEEKNSYIEIARDVLLCYAITRPYHPYYGLKNISDAQVIYDCIKAAGEIDRLLGEGERSKVAKLVLEYRAQKAEGNERRVEEIKKLLYTMLDDCHSPQDFYLLAKLLHTEERDVEKADKLYLAGIKKLEEERSSHVANGTHIEADYYRVIRFGLGHSRALLLKNTGNLSDAARAATSCLEIAKTVSQEELSKFLQAVAKTLDAELLELEADRLEKDDPELSVLNQRIDNLYEEAIELKEDYLIAYINYADKVYKADRYLKARNILEMAMESDINAVANFPNYYFLHLSNYQFLSGGTEEALESLKMALYNIGALKSTEVSEYIDSLEDFLKKDKQNLEKLDVLASYNLAGLVAMDSQIRAERGQANAKHIEVVFKILGQVIKSMELNNGYGNSTIILNIKPFEHIFHSDSERFYNLLDRFNALPKSDLTVMN